MISKATVTAINYLITNRVQLQVKKYYRKDGMLFIIHKLALQFTYSQFKQIKLNEVKNQLDNLFILNEFEDTYIYKLQMQKG